MGSGTITPNGVVTTGPATGTVLVTATAAGGVVGSITFDVSTATLTAIRVVPMNVVGVTPPLVGTNFELPVGLRVRFQAFADYTLAGGGTQTLDVTELANWSTNATTQYMVNNTAGSKGIVTAAATGAAANLTAAFGGMMASQGIIVGNRVLRMMNPVLTQLRTSGGGFADDLLATNAVPAGNTREIRVIGFFCDPGVNCGTTYDLTEQATLSVVNPAVAAIETIAGRPNARAVAVGTTQVRAVYSMQQDDANFEVSNACINAITLTPGSVQAAVTTPSNQSSYHTYTVTATRSDGSTIVATDPANGLIPGLSFAMTGAPGAWTVPGSGNDFTVQYTAAGTATMTARLTTGLCAGLGNVVSPAISIVATAATLNSVSVAPLAGTSMTRTTGQFLDYRATASYTLMTGGMITANVTGVPTLWTSGNQNISSDATIDRTNLRARFSPNTSGTGTTGTTFVRARLGTQEGSAPITVTGQAPTGIFIQYLQWREPAGGNCLTNNWVGVNPQTTPPPPAPPPFDGPVGGFRGRIRVMANYTPAAPVTDVTSQVTLTADNTVLSVASDGTVTTPMTMGATTTTTITATPTFPGVMPATLQFTLIAGPLNNVVIGARPAPGPTTVQVALGNTTPLFATGNFGAGAGTNFCISSNMTWSSSAMGTATVATNDSSTPPTAVVTPVAVGNAVITAANGGRSDTINVTVSAATPASLALQPASLSVQRNEIGQFRAVLTLSNAATTDVTENTLTNYWVGATFMPGGARFTNATISIDNSGGVLGNAAGMSGVTACYGTGFSNTTGCNAAAMVRVQSPTAAVTVTP